MAGKLGEAAGTTKMHEGRTGAAATMVMAAAGPITGMTARSRRTDKRSTESRRVGGLIVGVHVMAV